MKSEATEAKDAPKIEEQPAATAKSKPRKRAFINRAFFNRGYVLGKSAKE